MALWTLCRLRRVLATYSTSETSWPWTLTPKLTTSTIQRIVASCQSGRTRCRCSLIALRRLDSASLRMSPMFPLLACSDALRRLVDFQLLLGHRGEQVNDLGHAVL